MWTFDNLNAIHLELSSKCNAACPGCPRFLNNSPNVNPDLKQTEISLSDFKSWLTPDILSKIKSWVICGTHGDPITCVDFIDIVQYICDHSPGRIQINTNGGLRGERFFESLGETLVKATKADGVYREVVFSIDGLSDTNHIYRRNVIWHKLIKNIKAYINTGSRGAWEFLKFKHNVHQILEAQDLAEFLGLDFRVKNPYGVEDHSMPVYDKEYDLDYIISHHEDVIGKDPYVPRDITYIAPMPDITSQEGCISCNSFRDNLCEIYIDHNGLVHPCCFVSNKLYAMSNTPESTEIKHIQATIGKSNSLKEYGLKDILDNNELGVYSSSWNKKSINQCWLQCGIEGNGINQIEKLYV